MPTQIPQEFTETRTNLQTSSHKAAELSITPELIDAVAEAVAEKLIKKLLPFLNQPQSPDETLTVQDVAKLLKKSTGQIYQWVNQSRHGLGNFPYGKAGRSLRFSKAEVLEWVGNNAKALENG